MIIRCIAHMIISCIAHVIISCIAHVITADLFKEWAGPAERGADEL